MNIFKRNPKPAALAHSKITPPRQAFPYNPRNASFKVEPNIHVKATVYIVDEKRGLLKEYYDYVHSFEISEIERHGNKLIDRYNRMLDLNDRLPA